MKRLLILSFVALFAFVLAAAADDLAEVAKKEKARREALEKQGKKAKTLTNADVANIKSQLAIQSTSNTQTEPAAEATGSNQSQTQQTEQLSVSDQRKLEIAQKQQEIEQQITDLEKQKEATQQQIDDARNAVNSAGIYHSANPGNQYQTINAQEQKLQELDKQIDALKKQQEELESQKQ